VFSNLFSIILPNIGKYFPRNSLFKRNYFPANKRSLNRSELRLYSCWLCSCQVSVSTYKKKGGSVIPVRLSCICCECKTKKKTNMFIQREEEKAVYLNAGSGGEDGNLTSNTIFIEKRTISRHQLPRGLSQ